MLGAVMATTKEHLAEIGGFESLVDYFCDDYELGNRIAARGHRVELSQISRGDRLPAETLADAFRHQIRWNLSIRYSRPWGHLGLAVHARVAVGRARGVASRLRRHRRSDYVAAYAILRADVA